MKLYNSTWFSKTQQPAIELHQNMCLSLYTSSFKHSRANFKNFFLEYWNTFSKIGDEE